MDVVLKDLAAGADSALVMLGAKGEPWRQMRARPPGSGDGVVAVAAGQVTLQGIPDGTEGLAFVCAGATLLEIRQFMAGFTRQIPRLDALVPATMASNSGDHVLQVQGRGLSMSNELYFGSGGQKEPVRPFEQKIITTIIKTNLWAPGPQPVWVKNAGITSNVLTFTFT